MKTGHAWLAPAYTNWQSHREMDLCHERILRHAMIKFVPVSKANCDIAKEDGFSFLFREVLVSGYGIASAKLANCET